MSEEVCYKEFRIGDLFDVTTSKKIFHANHLSEIKDKPCYEDYPYVVRSTINNGIRGYISENPKYLNPGNTLSFAQDTFVAFYQEFPYFTGNKVKVLKPKYLLNKEIALYLITEINHVLEDYSWSMCSDVDFIANVKILLPVDDNGEPDFSYMSSYIKELETSYIKELETYLRVTGLSDYQLSPEDIAVLNQDKMFREFRIDDLLEKIETNKLPYQVDKLKGLHNEVYCLPALTAGIKNQGLSCYVPYNGATILKNCISVSANGANTGAMFYQDDNFTVLQDSYVLKLTDCSYANRYIYLYLIACMQKSIRGNFDWSNKAGWERIRTRKILLPVDDNGDLDFEYMEKYIRAIEKQTISQLYDQRTNELNITKSFIEET